MSDLDKEELEATRGLYNRKYIVIDIGCLECGADSYLVGVFTSREKAEEGIQTYTNGMFYNNRKIQIFEIENFDKIVGSDE